LAKRHADQTHFNVGGETKKRSKGRDHGSAGVLLHRGKPIYVSCLAVSWEEKGGGRLGKEGGAGRFLSVFLDSDLKKFGR